MPATQSQAPFSAQAALAPWMKFARLALIVIFSAALFAYVLLSIHWPLVWDMQVMHYVSFLIDHGWSPYRQIWDMNMPGAYLFEGWALHLFGSSDLGWRFYDFSLCAVLFASMIAIARRYDWLAGFVAASTFILVHASEGPNSAGQREQVLTTLLVLGMALCFEAARQRKPWLMFPFGLVTAMGPSIKPTLIFVGPAVLVLLVIHLYREKVRSFAYILWAVCGFALAAFIVLHFLLVHGSMQAFLFDLTKVLPNYATLHHASWSALITGVLPRIILLYLVLSIAIALLDRNLFNWEIAALLLCLLFGLLSFFGQRKGFATHRYTEMAFGLLWASLQIFTSVRGRIRPARALAYAALLALIVLNIPRDLAQTRHQSNIDSYSFYLEQDLRRIGTTPMQNKVQCLDIVDGCLAALYHLKLVESNGATGDLTLFLRDPSWVRESTRSMYWESIQQNTPTVFILSNREFEQERSFDKIDRWPLFADFLRQHYTLVAQREFATDPPTSTPGSNPDVPAYRIYLRKGSALLAAQPR